jgi:hypothetical protein
MRVSNRDRGARGRFHLRLIMNGREQSFAWTRLADQTVGSGVRVIVIPSAVLGEGFERREPTIVPWPTEGYDVSGAGVGLGREAGEPGDLMDARRRKSNVESSE